MIAIQEKTQDAKLSETRPILDNDLRRVVNKMPNADINTLKDFCIENAKRDFGKYGSYLDNLINKAVVDINKIRTHAGLIRYIDNKRALYDKYKK